MVVVMQSFDLYTRFRAIMTRKNAIAPFRKLCNQMHLVTEVQTYLLLGILRPRGAITHSDIERLVAWIIEQYSNRLRSFIVNLGQASVEPEVAVLIVRMADLAVESSSPIHIVLPPNLPLSLFVAEGFSPRIAFFDDEQSALEALA